jgi:hypothetical protein
VLLLELKGADVTKKRLPVLFSAAAILIIAAQIVPRVAFAGSHGGGSATHGSIPTGPNKNPNGTPSSSGSGNSGTHGPLPTGSNNNATGSGVMTGSGTKGNPGGHGLPPGSGSSGGKPGTGSGGRPGT